MSHERGQRTKSKYFLVPLWKSPMANETSFLITECPQFRVVILSESAIGKKNNLIISKYGVFGLFTIIYQISAISMKNTLKCVFGLLDLVKN